MLESAQYAATQLQRVVDGLHAGCEFGEMVVAEIRLASTRGDDQAVVGGLVGVTEQFRDDALPGQVDVGDVAQQYLDIALLTQHDPGRRSDFSLGDNPGGHLVQQRLEQVMGGARDQLDVTSAA